MRNYLFNLAIFAIFAVSASSVSGQDLEKKLLGTWKGNPTATEKYWKENKMDHPEGMLENAKGMTIKFSKENEIRLTMSRPDGGDRTIEGTFEVLEKPKDKKELKIKLKPTTEEGPPAVDVVVKFLEMNMQSFIAITPANDPPLLFNKPKQGLKEKAKSK